MVGEHFDQALFVSLKGMHLCPGSVLNGMSHYLHVKRLRMFLWFSSVSSFRAGRDPDNKDQSGSGFLSPGTINIWG